jgi:hypothetical protein
VSKEARIDEGRSLWKNLTRRRDRMMEHILRHPGLANLEMEGTVEGKICKERQILEFLRTWAENKWK